MPHRYSRISLDELCTAGVRMRHSDAVAIAREFMLRAARAELPGVPSPHSIRLSSDGTIAVEGPIALGSEVRRATCLLEVLLSRASADVIAPAAFHLIVARAHARNESSFTSLDEFAQALTPFAAPDLAAVVHTLVAVANSLADLDSADDDGGLSEFDTEDAPAPVVTLEPARDRRRPAAQRLGQALGARVALACAVAIVVVAAAVLGLRRTPVDQPHEVAASRNTNRAPDPNPAAPGEPSARSTPPAGIQRESARITAMEVLPTAAFSPTFARATSAMFYHSGSGSRSAIMRADTGSDGGILRVTTLVDDRESNFHPRPSPDGRSIAFDSDRDGERGVYVADANGRGARRVSGKGFAAVPSWSPDGRRLAFVRSEPGRPRVWNIWTVDVASGAVARITSHPYGQPWGAAWFPGGDRIAYSHEDRLIVRSFDRSSVRTFNSPIPRRLVRTPAVSPDGQHIIFQVRGDGVWMLDLAGERMRRILEDASAEEFTWSADGRRVAYHSRRSGAWGVWMMAPG